MRKKLIQLLDYLNPTLLMAPIIPLIYNLGFVEEDISGYNLFLLSTLIIVPLILIDLISRKSRKFIMFISLSILVLGGLSLLMYLFAVVFTGKSVMVGVPLVYTIEMVAIIIHHIRIRLTFAEQLEDEGRITKQIAHDNIFTRPSLYSFILLGAYYFLAMGFESKEVCNGVFVCSVVYIFMYIIYEFIIQTERYLELHKDVSGIPKKRVYGIGAGMVGIMLIIVFISILPSIALTNKRPYYDIRTILNYTSDEKYVPEMPEFDNDVVKQDNSFEELLDEQEIREWPLWAKALSQLIVVGLLLFALIMVLKEVFATFKRFEDSYNENGDIIESLIDDPEEVVDYIGEKNTALSAHDKKIRKQYKKAIRKARKENPMPYETPSEMETIAGVHNEEWMLKLHAEYEQARYGKGI